MPTNKFEALMKQIRVPIWLTKGLNFYVNTNTGSDNLDDGRGLSESKPFKTIRACYEYVSDNYNLSRFSIIINVAAGTYNESAWTLAQYNTNTGFIAIKGIGTVNVKFDVNGTCITCSYNRWRLQNLNISHTIDLSYWSSESTLNLNLISINCSNNGILELHQCKHSVTSINSNSRKKGWIDLLHASYGARFDIYGGIFSITGFLDWTNYRRFVVLDEQGIVIFGGSNVTDGTGQDLVTVTINGNFTHNVFAVANSVVRFSTNNIYTTLFKGTSTTGYKYYLETGSRMYSGAANRLTLGKDIYVNKDRFCFTS